MDTIIDYLYTLNLLDLQLLCKYTDTENIQALANYLYKSYPMPSAEKLWAQYGEDLAKKFATDRSAPKDVTTLPEEFFANDPTPGKKAVEWLITSYLNGSIHLFEDLSRARVALADYYYLLGKGIVNKYMQRVQVFCGLQGCTVNGKAMPGLETYLLDPKLQALLEARDEKKGIRKKYHVEPGEYEVIYEDDLITVTHPLSENAACTLGAGTTWCTAATKSENMFKLYNAKGPMYIITPKNGDVIDGRAEKYQFHPINKEFMDASDNYIDIVEFDTKYGDSILSIPLIRLDYILYYIRHIEKYNAARAKFFVKFIKPDELFPLLINIFKREFGNSDAIKHMQTVFKPDTDINDLMYQVFGLFILYDNLISSEYNSSEDIEEFQHKYDDSILKIPLVMEYYAKYYFTKRHSDSKVDKIIESLSNSQNNNILLHLMDAEYVSEYFETDEEYLSDMTHIISLLLKAGANPNAIDNNGHTVLENYMPYKDIVEILINAGADINYIKSNGNTISHEIINKMYNDTDYIKLLIDYGIDIAIKNNDGKTALDIYLEKAKGAPDNEIIKLLTPIDKLN